MGTGRLTLVWFAVTVGVAGYLTYRLTGDDSSVFLPGETSSGHHQIELACESCHTPFGGVRQDACLDCHQAELDLAQDSHDEAKFNDPRFAAELARLNARQCITCHVEHRPEITEAMGVTLPTDLCFRCHEAVGDDRPTHVGLRFDTCASSGCHNFHDNRALYEDFLVEHGNAEAATFAGILPERNAWIAEDAFDPTSTGRAGADAPPESSPQELVGAWAGSAHAVAGVTCSGCHAAGDAPWNNFPTREVCGTCHQLEPADYVAGKHGMREIVGLEPLSVAMARLPMHSEAQTRTLDCGACHDVHTVDVQFAAVDACLACHADEHTLAYEESPHFELWQAVVSADAPPRSGVSCASCHLPRETRRIAGEDRIVVQHNQNANLRPNEKMIRDVCLACHSLELSIDALADPELIRHNFSGTPALHVPSIDMALSRLERN